MTTTVTTTTVETLGSSAGVGAMLTLLLIGLLMTRELLSASGNHQAIVWRRVSLAAVVPLTLCFAAIVAIQIAAR